jgi:pyruvate dehydrogenase E2 component (dihydrolipoamide acetyltransferase)
MASRICMPSMGAMMEEGTILSWKVKEGEAVAKGQPLFEFESDKSSFTYESPNEGAVLKILIPEGQKAAVGQVIALLGEAGEDVAEALPSGPAGEDIAGALPAEPARAEQPASRQEERASARIKISPRARKLAEQLQVDISRVQGSGPGGRIESQDVERAAEKGGPASRPQPFSPARRLIQNTVILAKREIPHFYLDCSIDMTPVQIARREQAMNGVRLSYNAFFLKAAAHALLAVPVFRQTYTAEGFVPKNALHIALAVETPAGVQLPVIKDVDRKDLVQLSKEISAAVEKSRSGAGPGESFEIACLTVSNLGMYRVERLVPIIPPNQSAIIGIGAIADRPVIAGGAVQSRPMMTAALSVDHRIADGADAARFLQAFAAALESPG